MAKSEMCQGEGNNWLASTEDKPEMFDAFLYLTAFHLTSSALVKIKTVWLQDLRKKETKEERKDGRSDGLLSTSFSIAGTIA